MSVTQKTSTAQGRNRRDVSVTQDVGSQVVSQGDIRVEAGRDIVGKAATIRSTEGSVVGLAGRDVAFSAGERVTVTDDLTVSTKRRLFKKVSTTTHTVTSETQAVEGSVGGTSVSMQSGQDIHLTGSAVVADQQVQLVAGRDVTLDAKQTQMSQTVDVSRKTSGLFKSGPMALTLGSKRDNTHSVAEAVNQVGTRVGSLNGDVVIQAGRHLKQEGSHLMAPNGNVQVVAQKIDVVEAANTLAQSQDVTVKTSGVTVSESFALVTILQTANQMAHAGKDADDPRMEALAALSAGLSTYNALTQPAWSGSVMVGKSQMSSHSEQSAQSGVASTITAKNLTLMAVSSPALPGEFKPTAERDVTIRGSQIQVSGSAEVVAEGKINLLASQDQASLSSSNQSKSSGVGLGASLGPKGPVAGVKVEGSQGQGQAQGQSLTNRNTTIEVGEVASFKSGGDMSVKGAVVSAKQIVADVGGKLEIESLQDKRSYRAEQSSVSGSVTVGEGSSGTVSVSDSQLRHEFASVGEQSGLRAEDGGFQIKAASGIKLVGAQITSTQAAVDQHLKVVNAPSIEYADVQNKLETKGQAYSVSVTLGTSGPGFSGGVGHIDDHDTSVSRAGISGFGGQDSARTGDASTSLQNDFDASKAQAKLAAQVSITQTLSKEAPQAVANFAKAQMDQAAQQYEAAGKELDPQAKAQMQKDALDKMAAWDEGGRYRVAMHMAMGAAGAGWQGAIGAGAAAAAAPTMDQLQKNLRDELTPILGDTAAVFVSQGLIQLTTGAAGATLGGVQGAQWATAVDVNNRQLHPLEAYRIKQKANAFAQKQGISSEEAEARLGQQVLRNIDTNHENRLGPDDAQAQAFLKENGLGKEMVDVSTGERFQMFTADAATRENHAMFAQYAKRDATTRDELDRAYDPAFKPAGAPTIQGISGSSAGALSGSDIALGDAANDLSHMQKQSPEVQRQVFSELREQRQEIKQRKESMERELKEMNARGDRGPQAADRRTEITLELARLDHEDQYLRKASVQQLHAMGSAGVVNPSSYREWGEGFAEGFGVAGLRLNGAVSGRSGVLREPNPTRPSAAAASGETGAAGKVGPAEGGAGSKGIGEGAAPEPVLGTSPVASKAATDARGTALLEVGAKGGEKWGANKIGNADEGVAVLGTKLGNDAATQNAAKWIKPVDNYYDVVVHGTTDSVAVLRNGEWVHLDQRALSTFIGKQSDYTGQSIRLVSCDTGALDAGFAQNLSRKLGVDVMAPTDTLFVFPNGRTVVGPNQFTNSGEWRVFTPKKPGSGD